ncbi:MAG: GGDEF domain-containing protein [Myxococcales bacterium]|nr:GGDEF domain-containing protein [Myxococcales bacterium]
MTERVLARWKPGGWSGGMAGHSVGLIQAAHGPLFRFALLVAFTLMVAGTTLEVDVLGTVGPGPLWEPIAAVVGVALCLLATRPGLRRWLGPGVLWATFVGAWAVSRHAERSATPGLHLLAPLFLLLALGVFLAPTRRLGQAVIGVGAVVPLALGLLGWGAPITVGLLPLFVGGLALFMLVVYLLDGLHGALALYADEVDEAQRMDALTGVMARRTFLDFAQLRLSEARLYDLTVSLIYLDVDHFKKINDEHGHKAGDRVLKAVGQALREVAGERLIAGRLGGEEFALLLAGEANEARGWAEAARAKIKELAGVTASAGVATGTDLDDLLRRADAALYRAKRTGRDRLVSDVPLPVPAVPLGRPTPRSVTPEED